MNELEISQLAANWSATFASIFSILIAFLAYSANERSKKDHAEEDIKKNSKCKSMNMMQWVM